MGWKVFAILATEGEPGYLGTSPAHDPEKAGRLLKEFGLESYEAVGQRNFDEAMYPHSGSLYLGAYPRGFVICEMELLCYFFDESTRRRISGSQAVIPGFVERVSSYYPHGQAIAIVLHSVVDLWGYCLYEQGRLVRAAAGSADDGLMALAGEPLPEEERVLSECPIERVHEEGLGEDLVFDVTARFLGLRIDEFDAIPLGLTEFRRKPRGAVALLNRLWRRS